MHLYGHGHHAMGTACSWHGVAWRGIVEDQPVDQVVAEQAAGRRRGVGSACLLALATGMVIGMDRGMGMGMPSAWHGCGLSVGIEHGMGMALVFVLRL